MMVFEKLLPEIRRVIRKKGFDGPTEIQKLAIPKILEGKNVLLIAPTGTGKSEGAWLPIFHQFLKQKKKNGINILHITPLCSLNRDLIERIQFWAEELDIDAQVRHGDTTQYQRRKQALESPDLLVTTPETLIAILPGSRMREHLSHVKYVVIDEVHSFAGDKRGAHLSIALERLRELAGDFQVAALSATIGSPNKVAQFVVGDNKEIEVVKVPATEDMQILVESPPVTKLDKRKSNDLMASPGSVARIRRIHKLANEHKSSLIFVNTRHGVELLSLRMGLYDESFPFSAHHSSLSKDSRIGAEKKFKNGKLKSIVCLPGNIKVLSNSGRWTKIKKIQPGDQLQTINSSLKLENDEVLSKFRVPNEESLIQLETGIGKVIECTPDHKFLVLDDGKLNWKEARDINKGEFIATLREYSYSNLTESDLIKLTLNNYPKGGFLYLNKNYLSEIKRKVLSRGTIKEFWKRHFKKSCSYSQFKSSISGESAFKVKRLLKVADLFDLGYLKLFKNIYAVSFGKSKSQKVRISLKLMRLLGFVLADGSIDNERVRISNKRDYLLEFYTKLMEEALGKKSYPSLGSTGTPEQIIYSKFLYEFLKNLGFKVGRKATVVDIPDFIFQLDSRLVFEFLSGYFDGDGTLDKNEGRVYSAYFLTRSKAMVEDITKLLLREGILCSIRSTYVNEEQKLAGRVVKKKGDFYTAAVLGGENLRNFAKLINPTRKNLKKIKEVLKFPGYCNHDVIPNVGKNLRRLRLRKGISTYTLYKRGNPDPGKYERGERNIGRSQLEKLLKIYSETDKFLENLGTSSIFWDKIKNKDQIESNESVYTLEMESNHNYIAEGLISKNCTTSMEMGLDIGSIDLVMQYMSPRQVTELTQKVGRSGHRLGRTAKGIVISSSKDDILESIAIAEETLKGNLEPVRIHENALDALAHQIAGMALDEYKIELKKAYQIVKRAYPYRNLSYEKFKQVANQLKRERMIWIFDDKLKRKRNTWKYYYSNLSMIPDQRSFRVINIADRSRVGVLDEEFVVRDLERGKVFIIKGKPWRVVDISDEIYVEPVYSIAGAIPAWEGELMPVMYKVAQRVGKLREEIAKHLENGKENAVDHLVENYPLSKYTAYKAVTYVQKQVKKGKLPTNYRIVIESFKNFIIIHSCFGSLVNETLGRAISSKLTSRFGESVRMKADQYRILFELPVKLDPKEITQMIKDLEPDKLRLTLESALYKSNLLRWRVMHTAKKFGAVRPDVEYGKVSMRKLTGMFFDTPIYDEALRWTFVENLDLARTKEILQKIKAGKLKLVFDQRRALSPFAEGIFGKQLLELIAPKKAEKKVLEALEQRLLDKRVTLLCLYCLKWQTKLKLKNIKKLICPKCNAKLITALQRKESEYIKALKKRERGEKLTKEEKELCLKARRVADLVLSYGKKAILALSAYGIGPETASRILSKNLKSRKEFLREILEAEKKFIRTRRFWE